MNQEMGVDRQLPPKREVALALLQGSMVSVYLDPRGEEVRVPPWFKKQAQLMLQIGLNMPVPIPDLDVGEEALSCTLSFNRRPEFCRIPWRSIYALVGQDGRGMIWPDDVPPEVAAQAEGRASTTKASSHLRAVPDAPADEAEAPAKKATKSGAEKRKKKAAARSADKAAAETAQGAAKASSDKKPAEKKSAAEKKLGAAPATAATKDGPSKGAAAQQAGAPKAKRELPPYLRVVK